MRFSKLELEGAYLIDPEPIGDDRGFFSRLFCREEFKREGLNPDIFQINHSYSALKGTLRGMHYQLAPKEETKVIRCIFGAVYDVIIDLRPTSLTFGKWYGTTLTADNRRMIYVPKGFAHGFITLTENSEIMYFVSENYSRKHERGIRWDDPRFSIDWPAKPLVISKKDSMHPDFDPTYHLKPSQKEE